MQRGSIAKAFPGGVKNTDVFPAAYRDVLAAAPGNAFASGPRPPDFKRL